MVLDDRHIKYLLLVKRGEVLLVYTADKSSSTYRSNGWANGRQGVDQSVAINVELMGLTHIIVKDGKTYVDLTPRGHSVLEDENEAWG